MKFLRIILLLVLLLYALTGIRQIGPDERAMVKRFGQIVAHPGPGLWIGWPWGIDQVDKIQVKTARQLTVGFILEQASDQPDVPPGQLITGDQNVVNLKWIIEYTVDDREGMLEAFLMNRGEIDRILSREVEALGREWTGCRKVEEVLSGRALLTLFLTRELPRRLDQMALGIQVQRISIEYLAPPEEVKDAFEAVNQAQTTIATRVNEAQQEAQRQLNDALSFAQQAEAEALASREEKRKYADSEAQAFRVRQRQFALANVSNNQFYLSLWREEIGKLLARVVAKGRIEVLDHYLGPQGLELNQFLPVKR